MLRNALTTPDAAFDTIDHRIERLLQKFELVMAGGQDPDLATNFTRLQRAFRQIGVISDEDEDEDDDEDSEEDGPASDGGGSDGGSADGAYLAAGRRRHLLLSNSSASSCSVGLRQVRTTRSTPCKVSAPVASARAPPLSGMCGPHDRPCWRASDFASHSARPAGLGLQPRPAPTATPCRVASWKGVPSRCSLRLVCGGRRRQSQGS